MFRRLLLLNLILLGAVTFSATSEAAWLWDPQTGKWTNTKDVARDTPDAQFEVGKKAYDEENYPKALDEFDKLIRHFPNNRWAAQAQFYKGLTYEKTDNVGKAAEAFRTVVDRYPYSDRINDAIEKEYQIAEAMMQGKKTKVLGMAIMPAEDEAADLYRHIVRNAPYGPYGAAAQYRLGDAELLLGNFLEAERAYKAVLDEYPNSEWSEKAKLQIAKVSYESAMTDEYNQDRTNEAIEKYQGLQKTGNEEVDTAISELRLKKAESVMQIATFYYERKKYPSAKIYLEDVIRLFPEIELSKKAQTMLDEVNEKLGMAEKKDRDKTEENEKGEEKRKPFLGLF